jgi:futalosine hydrolase
VRLLIAAATAFEVAPLATALSISQERAVLRSSRYRGHSIDLLITGVGMVATAAWCARTLAADHYDLALNLGVCGSFAADFTPGMVVNIVTDRIAELGAEDGDEFLTIHQMQLLAENEFPFTGGQLVNAELPANTALAALPRAHAITVNTVHGADDSIATTRRRFEPQVESMEGAAFMYAALIARVSFAQIRAVSNVVERRNRAAWKLPEAIAALNRTAIAVLEQL